MDANTISPDEHAAMIAALQWYTDHGVDEGISDQPFDDFAAYQTEQEEKQQRLSTGVQSVGQAQPSLVNAIKANQAAPQSDTPLIGTAELVKKPCKLPMPPRIWMN